MKSHHKNPSQSGAIEATARDKEEALVNRVSNQWLVHREEMRGHLCCFHACELE